MIYLTDFNTIEFSNNKLKNISGGVKIIIIINFIIF